MSIFSFLAPRASRGTVAAVGLTALFGLTYGALAAAQTNLADQPIAAGANIPGNLALALSVEFPTAISVANIGSYVDASTYLGYFDPLKCYTYNYNSTTPSSSYFQPASLATGTNLHTCSGQWSGNFMNWATMQTIDPFRWALSGGYRSVDTATQTILEKAWGSAQGSASANFNYRGTSRGSPHNLPSSLISAVTPFSAWDNFDTGIWGNGNTMVFSGHGNGYKTGATSTSVSDLSSVATANTDAAADGPYRVYIRVDVCDATTTLGTSGLESNCVQYGSNYKPEGLMQQYSNKVQFSALGYLNGLGSTRQGGVLRKPMGFIGPTYPQPLSPTAVTNTRAEWSATTGVQSTNPDTVSAGVSGVSQSGVLNYLNKFGETSRNYMTYDDVSELYYAAVRYYENLGNVPEWTNSATAAELDGFPALPTWTDPISYWCQKNFILGIGDDHTWYDYNVGGGTYSGGRAKPAAVSSDTFNQAATWTTNMQNLEGITPAARWPFDTDATYYIAGLAYGVHVNDIRTDATMPNAQTITTFWMDVEEGGGPENLNPYYLAAKYGGFTPATSIPAAPTGAPYNMTTALTLGQWDTTGTNITMNGNNTHPLPDNYFLAGSAGQMVAGLKSAFTNISNAVNQSTTAFSFSSANVTSSGAESFQATYDSSTWSSTVQASNLTFDTTGNPVITSLWNTGTTLPTQFGGTGWQTGRNIATWNGSVGVPFEPANLTATQLAALLPSYSPSSTATQYLDYLRGDQTNEVGSTVGGSTHSLRKRTVLLGDIIDAALTPVTTPVQTFSESSNPGYAAFKTQWTTTTPRPTMVYAGANDGMLHGFLGSSGTEQFAYIPSALFLGPNNTPQVDGLAQLGNPNYSHHFYVDATPINYDIDLNHTYGSGSTTPNWATLLIGGLGKGGKSFYAIDVTDPASMTSESAVAGKVQWEFTDSTMGYSYGAPVVVKTVKYGWVVILTSGYNNSDGYGYVYFVNPKTGALLEKVKTPSASSGLTQASAFVMSYSDDTADSLYVGDLNGQLWRFDLRGSGTYPQPTLLATLTDSSGNAQPVTTAPLIEIHPSTRQRYVMVGTGQLLAATDIASTAMQSFYAIIDGTAGAFLPVSTPITRASLTQLSATNLVGGAVISSSNGWFTDLGIDSGSGIGWRIVLNPLAYNGTVVFTDLLTVATDPCSPSGVSRIYALNYATATSVLQPTLAVPYDSYVNQVINVRITGANGNPEIVAGFSNVATPPVAVPANLAGTLATRILNWREIPTAD
jgi:type IV pilus assembly protein PilY1